MNELDRLMEQERREHNPFTLRQCLVLIAAAIAGWLTIGGMVALVAWLAYLFALWR